VRTESWSVKSLKAGRLHEMRIIAGRFKGRRLVSPRGRDTRPTAARVREAVFDICGRCCEHAVVADLFAGTGAFGLEALSRGADYSLFIDSSPASVSLVRKNISACRMEANTKVLLWDAARSLTCLERFDRQFTLIFADPPYGSGLVSKTLKNLSASRAVSAGARVILEHAAKEIVSLPENLVLVDRRRYGRTVVTFLEKS